MLSSVFRNRRLLTVALATVMTATTAWAPGPVAAADPYPSTSPAPIPASGNLTITPDQWAQLNAKLGFISEKGIWGEFVLKNNGTLTTVDSLPEIQEEFGLSDEQVNSIQGILDYAAQNKNAKVPKDSGGISPNLSLNGTVLYLTYSDMVAFLFNAALMGPAALAAALNALGWMFGGPIGGAVALILSIIGIATIANLAYLIIQAHVLHRGIYFGIVWTPFPNYTQGLWCGCN